MLTFRIYFRIKNEMIAVIIMEIIERTQIRLQTDKRTERRRDNLKLITPQPHPLHKQLRCV